MKLDWIDQKNYSSASDNDGGIYVANDEGWRHISTTIDLYIDSPWHSTNSLEIAKAACQFHFDNPDLAKNHILQDFVKRYKSGDQGCEMDCDAARLMALAIEKILPAPSRLYRECKDCNQSTKATQISCIYCGLWDEPAALGALSVIGHPSITEGD